MLLLCISSNKVVEDEFVGCSVKLATKLGNEDVANFLRDLGTEESIKGILTWLASLSLP